MATSLLGTHATIASSEPCSSGPRGTIWGEKKQLLLKQMPPLRARLSAEPPICFGRSEAPELSTSYFKMPLFVGILGSKQIAQEGMHTCAPSANKSGKKKRKPRGAFSRRPSASTTPLPTRRVHSLFSFPLKSPHQPGSGKLNLCSELWVYYS